jgi:hypothetical protein
MTGIPNGFRNIPEEKSMRERAEQLGTATAKASCHVTFQ